MQNPTESTASAETANTLIESLAHCADEGEVKEVTLAIVRQFEMQVFVFSLLVRNRASEHHQYMIGCDPEFAYRYLQNRWQAIDPYVSYARQNTRPVLSSDVPVTSPGQRRMRQDAKLNGFRSGIVIPAHSNSSALIGLLYLGTSEGLGCARRSLDTHRSLMRVLALELLDWRNARQRDIGLAEFGLDDLDVQLLCKARDRATAEEAASALGVTRFCVDSRYERLNRKLDASCKRYAVEKAIALGLISPL